MIGEMREAERILMVLADESAFPEDYLEAFHTTQIAVSHEKLNPMPDAAEQLELALENKGLKKEEKIRYTYILAQLYEESGQNNLALEKYKRVTRYNPPYEMAFNARVSMAEVFESGSASSADLKKLLEQDVAGTAKTRSIRTRSILPWGILPWRKATGNRPLNITSFRYPQAFRTSTRRDFHP